MTYLNNNVTDCVNNNNCDDCLIARKKREELLENCDSVFDAIIEYKQFIKNCNKDNNKKDK